MSPFLPTRNPLAVPHTPELPLLRRATFRAPSTRPDAVPALDAGGEPADLAVPLPVDPAPIALQTQEQEQEPEQEPEQAQAQAPAPTPRTVSHKPRHRADHVRNRRATGGAFRRTVALGCATAILGVSAFGAVAASADDDRTGSSTIAAASGTKATSVTDTIAAPDVQVDAYDGPTVTSDLSVAAAPFSGGTQVTVSGDRLDEVAAVSVGGVPATIVAAADTQMTFAVPAVADTALGTAAVVSFADAAGAPVEVETPTAVVAAGTSVVQPLTGELTGAAEPKAPMAPRTLSLTYTSDPGIDAQVAYVLAHWSDYNSGAYPVLSGNDCANFASQSLVARGWSMDGGWYYDGGSGAMSPTWASSTALGDYLRGRTDRATELDDSQRTLVKVGDIAQFDWDGSGDRDHTAVVTRVEHSAAGTKVWVGGHTKDADYWDVDEALASGGGSVHYFSIR